jgi:hypothetical protein
MDVRRPERPTRETGLLTVPIRARSIPPCSPSLQKPRLLAQIKVTQTDTGGSNRIRLVRFANFVAMPSNAVNRFRAAAVRGGSGSSGQDAIDTFIAFRESGAPTLTRPSLLPSRSRWSPRCNVPRVIPRIRKNSPRVRPLVANSLSSLLHLLSRAPPARLNVFELCHPPTSANSTMKW